MSDHNKIIITFCTLLLLLINVTCQSSIVTDLEPLQTFGIKIFEIINRFLVLLHSQLSLGFIEKCLNMSRNRRTYSQLDTLKNL